MAFFWMILAIMGFAAFAVLLSWLWGTRCPSCGRFFAAKVWGETETASVTTEEQIYDQETGSYRTASVKQSGYLVDYSCRRCGHSWQRIRSTSQSRWIT